MITEQKHTQGEWLADEPMGQVYVLKSPLVRFIVAETQSGSMEEQAANTRLIAAAKDMLEALKALLPDGWGADDTMDHMPSVKLARLAIAKAEGRS